MGFSYRKSVKMGPFRVTASKSGVSYSAGVKGARVTKRANGRVQTTLSVPGTGLRYTTTSGTKKKPTTRASTRTTAPPRRVTQPPKPVSRPAPAVTPRPAPAHRPARQPQQALPPRSPRPPKPVRLRGTRYSTFPRIASPWLLPFSVKVASATVTIHGGGIHLQRKHANTRYGAAASVDIAWHELASIDFLEPGRLFHSGHAHFAAVGEPRGLGTSANAAMSNWRNPHAVRFEAAERRAYRQLRDLLTGSTPAQPQLHQPPAYAPQPPAYPPQGQWR
ncbi:MAG: hypothetical protein JWM19_2105 [Actinomycetia bacterium]|nr:hypothetical protein [Actinomycetes bacterium]